MVSKESLADTRQRYRSAVVLGDPAVARSVIEMAIEYGATPAEIYLDVLAPTQAKLGEMWHEGIINVAQEHFATAITMQMMDLQRLSAKPRSPLGVRAIVVPVEGDQHFIGARMLADLLLMDGWDVDFFWHSTPARDLAEYVQQRRVHILALSSTMTEFLPYAKSVAVELKKLKPPRPKVLLGGAALKATDVSPDDLGADAIVTDLLDAVGQARRIVGINDANPTLEQHLASMGQKIRAARNAHKLTQQQLADASGLDRTYVSLVEHGKQNLTIAAVLKIADALDVSISDLLGPTANS